MLYMKSKCNFSCFNHRTSIELCAVQCSSVCQNLCYAGETKASNGMGCRLTVQAAPLVPVFQKSLAVKSPFFCLGLGCKFHLGGTGMLLFSVNQKQSIYFAATFHHDHIGYILPSLQLKDRTCLAKGFSISLLHSAMWS